MNDERKILMVPSVGAKRLRVAGVDKDGQHETLVELERVGQYEIRIVTVTEDLALAVSGWVARGLDELLPSEDGFVEPRLTASVNPLFLDRLADYIHRQAPSLIVRTEQ
jgi:hypothetical protein